MSSTCTYKTPDGEGVCGRSVDVSDKCLFHLPESSTHKLSADKYFKELKKLVEKKDTSWAGFIFPNSFKLYDLTFKSDVDLRWSRFQVVTINNINFHKNFDMSHSSVNGKFHISSTVFEKQANFYDSTFLYEMEVNADFIGGMAGFHGCNFHGRASFRGTIAGTGTFHKSIFHEAVEFRGGRDITITVNAASMSIASGTATISSLNKDVVKDNIFQRTIKCLVKLKSNIRLTSKNMHEGLNKIDVSTYINIKKWLGKQIRRFIHVNDGTVKINWLFESVIQMTEVEFRRPENTKFMDVDMSAVNLVGTDMQSVHFYNVKFYQSALNRNGLHDDVADKNIFNYSDRKYILPRIESEYRNIRVAMENNRNYSTASDFYVGEMEMKRKQMFFPQRYLFSLAAFYQALSNYGASPFRAVRMFLWIVILHSSLTMAFVIEPNLENLSKYNFSSEYPAWNEPLKTSMVYIVNSLKILTLQRGDAVLSSKLFEGHLIDAIFRILGPLQLTLIAFATRVRIKRH